MLKKRLTDTLSRERSYGVGKLFFFPAQLARQFADESDLLIRNDAKGNTGVCRTFRGTTRACDGLLRLPRGFPYARSIQAIAVH